MGFRSEICNFFAVSLKLIQEHVSAMPKFAWKQHFFHPHEIHTCDELITDDAVKSALERVKDSMGADFDNPFCEEETQTRRDHARKNVR